LASGDGLFEPGEASEEGFKEQGGRIQSGGRRDMKSLEKGLEAVGSKMRGLELQTRGNLKMGKMHSKRREGWFKDVRGRRGI
jgi:hypothetical protein